MTRLTFDTARRLHELGATQAAVAEAETFVSTLSLDADADTLCAAIDEGAPAELTEVLKSLAKEGHLALFPEVADVYRNVPLDHDEPFTVTLTYVTAPTDEQLAKLQAFVNKKYHRPDVVFETVQDDALIGGFKLRCGNQEYDWSVQGRSEQLKKTLAGAPSCEKGKENKLLTVLRHQIEEFDLSATDSGFDLDAEDREIGVVEKVGDGIATIRDIHHAMYGEILLFDCGVQGMVQDIRPNNVGCILFGSDSRIREGSRVIRTEKMAGIPVGEGFLGRVVDALGAPIDGGEPIKADGYRPVENAAPGIIDRKSVSVPLQTGILSIDSMFPIGRGQRELIIGDRQTGKTSIAVDTILNQKDKDVLCIYVAIGQKASTVAKIVGTLKKHGAMDYTTVVVATASDPAPLQYIAPYAGTALAEQFMYEGKDVLIVYDDLSKHAVAYRALSLLLERSPGREAYPGDVFYLHSRLLERSSRLTPEMGGGSITALPIIETQAGDVSAYIPTNVISITDGQIFLESDLFFSGMRPAVNVGLSVSRVGGAAQTKAMKKAAGSIRLSLAQYREMEIFTQFSSDLDANTLELLQYGRGLMELLKQPLCAPLSMHEQVITLVAATGKVMLDIEPANVKKFQTAMLAYFEEKHAEIGREIETQKAIDDSMIARIREVAGEFKANEWIGG